MSSVNSELLFQCILHKVSQHTAIFISNRRKIRFIAIILKAKKHTSTIKILLFKYLYQKK